MPPQKQCILLTICVHLLTVLYDTMIEQVKTYEGLGVIWVLWIVLGQFSDLFCHFRDADFASPKDVSQLLLGCFCPSFDCFASDDPK